MAKKRTPAMSDKSFWGIIESGGRKSKDDQDKQLKAIQKALRKLSPEEIIGFHQQLYRKRAEAYKWDLWGAAYLINGGCSDDGFDYFLAWLVGQGQKVYEAAVKNPDSLSAIVDPDRDDYEFESLLYAAVDAYEKLTKKEIPYDGVTWPENPAGKDWDFDDDELVQKKLPKLANKYLS